MSHKSDIVLLREELTRLAVENRELRETVCRLEAVHGGTVAALKAEIDRLILEIAERDRRLAKYENAHVPSSTGSLYNEKRAAFRKKMAKAEGGYADGDGDQGGPESDDDDNNGKAEGEPSRRGTPAGHTGASHKNKADRTVVLGVCRCGTCGRGHLRKMSPVVGCKVIGACTRLSNRAPAARRDLNWSRRNPRMIQAPDLTPLSRRR